MTQPINAHASLQEWLDHPSGGPLLRALLTELGQSEQALTPVLHLPLVALQQLSQGRLPQAVIDDLVLRANDGHMPDPETVQSGVWTERISPNRFSGQTVIVTGAASGIGRATASRVAREGGRVIAVDVSQGGLQEFAASHAGHEVSLVVADITSQDDVERIIAAAEGRLDALANVAAIADDMTPLHEVSDAMWSRVMAVNVEGLFRLTRAALPLMLAAQRGSIVNVASEAALRGSAAGLAYTTSKHAVVGLTRSSAYMYGPSGIRVNAVAPGGVATGMHPNFASEFGRERLRPALALVPPIALPEQLAASISFLLSDDATNLNGVILPADGGWSAG